MVQFLEWIQYIGIIILIIEIVFVLLNDTLSNQSIMLVFIIATLINTVGYLVEMQATTQESAMYAVKIAYLGKPFISFATFLFIMNFCRVRIHKWIQVLLFLLHTSVAVSALTSTYHKFFYTSVSFTQEGLFPHVVLGHGFVYYLFIGIIVVYCIIMITACVIRYRKVEEKNEKHTILYLIGVVIVAVSGFALYLAGLTSGYDATAFAYVIDAILLLICSIKYDCLGTLTKAKDKVIDTLSDGIVVIDISNTIIYVNNVAQKLYPELDGIHASSKGQELVEIAKRKEKIFVGSEVYELSISSVYNKSSITGKLITIENITDDYYYKNRLQHDVEEKTKEIKKIQSATIHGFASMVEARDDVTGGHIKNTSNYVELLCKEMKNAHYMDNIMTDEYISRIKEAAPLHDIGKIALPDAILGKQGKLTTEEYDIIKTHAQLGANLISDIIKDAGNDTTLEIAKDMANYHHERWDGTGYPYGLKQNSIPVCARIMALADVYDALTSERSYKEAYSRETAIQIIKEGAGTQFDPALTELFLKVI